MDHNKAETEPRLIAYGDQLALLGVWLSVSRRRTPFDDGRVCGAPAEGAQAPGVNRLVLGNGRDGHSHAGDSNG